MQRPLEWQIATVKGIKVETPHVKTFTLSLPDWHPHKAGQHYDLRLTAADGYQAQRSYSIASEPERQGEVDLTVEKIEDGEVSPYLHYVIMTGDQIEVRGPIGGYFVWETKLGGPVLLVAGGSGVVPLMAMVRHHLAQRAQVPMRLLYSSRTRDDVIYFQELEKLQAPTPITSNQRWGQANLNGVQVLYTFTRSQPEGWKGYSRRIDAPMLREVTQPLGNKAQVFICGPTALVEGVANSLVQIGIAAGQIKTERFGPSGA